MLGFDFASHLMYKVRKFSFTPLIFFLLFVNGTVNRIGLTEPYFTVRFG